MRIATLLLLLLAGSAFGATYHVGPKEELPTPSAVPWESLQAGDIVLIDWRPEPYRDKWVIGRQGTAAAPIIVRGVPGPKGELPVIEGGGAVTRRQLNYWGDSRGVIKIGGATVPPLCVPRYITLENLEIRGGRSPNSFIAADGKVKPYSSFAAALYVEKAEHLTVRHCILRDSGNGLFISSNGQSASGDILIEGCHIFDNGISQSGQEHNVYTEARGITFQYNYLGRLRLGCAGNNLKDRSSGLVIRYNWIEGGDKELDLVDAEDSSIVRDDPRYRQTFVYGNIIIKPAGKTHPQVIHYGGDSGQEAFYRQGTLYFYNNTVVSRRTDLTTLLWLSSDGEKCDCRNNILYTVGAGKNFAILQSRGAVELSHDWLKTGWKKSASAFEGVVREDGSLITGISPGFLDEAADDFQLAAKSPCRQAGGTLAPATLPGNAVTREYIKHQDSRARPGPPWFIGAD